MLQTPVQFSVIKTCILEAHQKQIGKLDDHMLLVRKLCETIEELFRLGLLPARRNRDYYHWMECVINILRREKAFIHPDFEDAVNSVRKNASVCSPQGRGRLLIRILLQRGRLDFPITFMQTHAAFALRFYNTNDSVLGHEILVQIFCSLISEVCRLNFELQLDNSEFLDETWEMPLFEQIELVPCVKLGARLETMEGHVIVVEVDSGGVAAEENRIEVGDVLVTMYGQHLRQAASQIPSLRASHDGQPVPVGVVKARMPDGSIYRPLRSMFKRHNAEHLLPVAERSKSDSCSNESNRSFFANNPWCRLLFLGHCDVGSDGGVHMINQCIMHVLQRRPTAQTPTPVHIELGELGVTIWPVKFNRGSSVQCGSRPLFRHSFPQISSCGRRTDNTNYLAYIVGDEACTVAKHFRCFVFEAVNHAESKYWISAIAQGFDRTHWTL